MMSTFCMSGGCRVNCRLVKDARRRDLHSVYTNVSLINCQPEVVIGAATRKIPYCCACTFKPEPQVLQISSSFRSAQWRYTEVKSKIMLENRINDVTTTRAHIGLRIPIDALEVLETAASQSNSPWRFQSCKD